VDRDVRYPSEGLLTSPLVDYLPGPLLFQYMLDRQSTANLVWHICSTHQAARY
jgi:hypothetical protein